MKLPALLITLSLNILLSSCATPEKEPKFHKEIVRAMDYADAGKYALAIALCDSLIEVDSTYDRAYFERGMTYLELKADSSALRDFEKVTEIDPNYPGLRDWHASTLHQVGRHLEAAKLKHEELRAEPDGGLGMGVSPTDWSQCADYFHDAGLTDSAISVLDEYFNHYAQNVTEYKDSETTPLRTYARLMIEKKDFERAFSEMETAMKSPDKVPADYAVWIEVNILNGNYSKAQEVLDYYVREIHDGDETEDAKRLKKMVDAAIK